MFVAGRRDDGRLVTIVDSRIEATMGSLEVRLKTLREGAQTSLSELMEACAEVRAAKAAAGAGAGGSAELESKVDELSEQVEQLTSEKSLPPSTRACALLSNNKLLHSNPAEFARCIVVSI